jgi:hypothetical protein
MQKYFTLLIVCQLITANHLRCKIFYQSGNKNKIKLNYLTFYLKSQKPCVKTMDTRIF